MLDLRAKSVICVLAMVLSGCAAVPEAAVDAQWEALPDLLRPVVGSAASVSGDHFIVTGGVRVDLTASADVQVLDLETLTWSLGAPLVEPRLMHGQVTLDDGRVLVAGGRQFGGDRTVALDACELLSADGLTSTPTDPLPGAMATPRLHKLSDGRIVAVGGDIAAAFDPATEQWGHVVSLRESRSDHATVLLADQTVLVIGGLRRDSIERVDLETASSRMLSAKLPMALDDLSAVLLDDGRVWVLGGQDSTTGLTTDRTWLVSLNDGDSSSIERGPNLPNRYGMADQRVVVTPGGVVLIGGEAQTQFGDIELKDVLLIDPSVSPPGLARLPDTAEAHDDAVSAWADGWLIVAGGQVTGRGMNMLRLPLPVMRVERLRWPVQDGERALD